VVIQHVRRAQNSDADRLCNEALDGRRLPSVPSPPPKPSRDEPRISRQQRAREKTLACLRTAAAAWARGNANDPAPEMICHEVWNILEATGVLRRRREANNES
jgi:hypothetical protein